GEVNFGTSAARATRAESGQVRRGRGLNPVAAAGEAERTRGAEGGQRAVPRPAVIVAVVEVIEEDDVGACSRGEAGQSQSTSEHNDTVAEHRGSPWEGPHDRSHVRIPGNSPCLMPKLSRRGRC